MATVCYFTTLKMSLHRILMSIACDERSAVIKNISGMEWGGWREDGSGWGTHVNLWRIHFDIWQI